ncbi:hypothetical protein Q9L58_009053 [Maublancomyces gigas]|uniref:DUF159-domain-containing protein n=1 Tax=Discina gigas TaxID=1032678 RepID=A0ABR3G7Y3_9PEZI
MCGRYALAYPAHDVGRRLIEDGMPVDEAPGDGDVQPGYNIAPGHVEPVYRAIPGAAGGGGAGVRYVLGAMKWGLIPSWTKRSPDYSSFPKTINCRDDSLFENKGMWTSMKHKKRCIVVAQGFYEWLKKGNEKAGCPPSPPLSICSSDNPRSHISLSEKTTSCYAWPGSGIVSSTTEKVYTYTIITTTANKQLSSLHCRMPVILENGSAEIRAWLDPATTWNTTLQTLLQPYRLELEVYPVVKDVGNVRNNSPTFIVPLDSKDNKANIKNFFTAGAKPTHVSSAAPIKRTREEFETAAEKDASPPSKAVKMEDSEQPTPRMRMRSATSNLANKKSPASPAVKRAVKRDQTPRITSFFTK